jgi:histidinol-phosphate aminotransferase
VGRGIIVRNRTNVALCHNCLRITVGTRPENDELLRALREFGM